MPDDDHALARQNAALTRALLEWVASGSRTYRELVDTWRSTCPRHAILEDAQAAGLIDHDGRMNGTVRLTPAGARMLG
ncbi:MAG: hypothetical protein ACM3NZ_13380 [Betaproteobacteria bacterium]|jgi:hypothetical protein